MSGYERGHIETLLPAVWDIEAVLTAEKPYAPDPDMPKAKANPKTANTIYACIADIRQAWDRAHVPVMERQALILRYGLGWKEREIAAQLGRAQQTVSDWLVRGVGRLMDWLNGDEHAEGEPA